MELRDVPGGAWREELPRTGRKRQVAAKEKKDFFLKKKRLMLMEHGTRLDADESMTGTNTKISVSFHRLSLFYANRDYYLLSVGGGGRV